MARGPSLDGRLRAARAVAWRQDGLLDADQLAAHGLGNPDQWKRLVARGLLERRHSGVFRLTDAPRTRRQDWRAALMWRKEATLSHWTAATYWGFTNLERARVHINVGAKVSTEFVEVHRQKLWAKDAVERNGLRVTTPERTLMDLAPLLDEERLQTAVEDAWRRRLIDPESLLRRLRDMPYQARKDVGALPALLLQAHQRGKALESPLEVRFWRLLRMFGLPLPKVQFRMRDDNGELRVDFFWEEAGLVVETQGRAFHLTTDGFERSAARSQRLAAMGLTMVVVTWLQLEQDPSEVMDRIARALTMNRGPALRAPVIYDEEPVPPEVLVMLDAAA